MPMFEEEGRDARLIGYRGWPMGVAARRALILLLTACLLLAGTWAYASARETHQEVGRGGISQLR